MAKKAELKAVLTLNNSKFYQGINAALGLAKRFAKQLKANPVRTLGLGAIVASERALFAGGVAALAFKAAAVGAFVIISKKAIDAASQLETIKVGFEVLLGSAEKANERVAALQKFALKTPFDLPEIASASRQLEVMTEGALSGVKALTMISDVAAGTTKPFGDMALTVGRLYASLRAGLPAGNELRSLMDAGAVTHPGFLKIQRFAEAQTPQSQARAWAEVVKEFGRFAGMSERLSKTWGGALVQFHDAVRMSFASIGDRFLPSLTAGVHAFTDEMIKNQALFKDIGDTFAGTLKGAVDYVTNFLHEYEGKRISNNPIKNILYSTMMDMGEGMDAGLRKVMGDRLTNAFAGLFVKAAAPIGGQKLERYFNARSAPASGGIGVGMDSNGKRMPAQLPAILLFLNSLRSIALKTGGLQSGKLGSGLPESISKGLTLGNPLGEPSRRVTPFLRFRERRAVSNQIRANEMALRYSDANKSGRAEGDTRIRQGDRKRMQAVLRDQAKREQQALTNKTFEEFIKKFDQFAAKMGGN